MDGLSSIVAFHSFVYLSACIKKVPPSPALTFTVNLVVEPPEIEVMEPSLSFILFSKPWSNITQDDGFDIRNLVIQRMIASHLLTTSMEEEQRRRGRLPLIL